MIQFTELPSTEYRDRTKEVIKRCDVTLAIAVDFTSAGEILTRKLCGQMPRHYIPLNMNREVKWKYLKESIKMYTGLYTDYTLNIAGNGIYTLKNSRMTQSEVNKFVCEVVQFIHSLGKLKKIITGGQSGIDEAGAKASYDINKGIECEVFSPKGWKFRNANGVDISDEKLFKERFY